MVARVMIVQRRHTGHHLAYVAMFADWSQRAGLEMTLLVKPGTVGTPEWQEHLSPCASAFEVVEGGTDLEQALRVARDRGIDRIVLPGGDHYLLPILRHWRLCRKVPLTVLIMRPNGQQSASAFVRPLKSCGKRILRSLATHVSRARVFTLTSALNPRPRRRELRDPVWSQRAPSEPGQRTSPADRRWIGVVGSLSARKNIELIAETMVARPGLHHTGLLLAGQQSDTVRRQLGVLEKPLEEAGVDLRTVDRTLSDEELVHAVDSVDVLAIAHSNEGASGILAMAATRGVRVVCAGARSLRQDIRWHPQIGSWVPLESEALAGALEAALEAERPRPLLDHGTTEEFAAALMGGVVGGQP